jgi:hypothetical protein
MLKARSISSPKHLYHAAREHIHGHGKNVLGTHHNDHRGTALAMAENRRADPDVSGA